MIVRFFMLLLVMMAYAVSVGCDYYNPSMLDANDIDRIQSELDANTYTGVIDTAKNVGQGYLTSNPYRYPMLLDDGSYIILDLTENQYNSIINGDRYKVAGYMSPYGVVLESFPPIEVPPVILDVIILNHYTESDSGTDGNDGIEVRFE